MGPSIFSSSFVKNENSSAGTDYFLRIVFEIEFLSQGKIFTTADTFPLQKDPGLNGSKNSFNHI